MSKIAIKLYNREYIVNCGVGEEDRLKEIVQFIETKMTSVADRVGNTTEPRLLMLTCLSLADELLETRRRVSETTAEDEELLIAAVQHLKDRVTQITAQIGHA